MAKNAITISGERGSASEYGIQTRNRLRALVDDALGLLDGPKRMRREDGRDVREAIAWAFLQDPVGTLERLNKLLPGAEQAAASGGVSIQTLYLQAVQNAQPQPLRVIDAEDGAGTSRVHDTPSSSNDW